MAESVEDSTVDEDLKTAKIKFDPLEHFLDKKNEPSKKIIFLGDGNIGKTTFIQKYCENVARYSRFSSYNGPQLVLVQFLVYQGNDEKNDPILLMDFPPGTTEESRLAQYPDVIDSIVLCFAIDNPTSFANVWKVWLPEAKKKIPDFDRFYLLGLKNDKRKEMAEENKTPVYVERGCQIHEKYKFCGQYMECSVEKTPQEAFNLMNTLISDV